jgi:PAS domain S-box-containing protein
MKASHSDQFFELMSQGAWQVDAAGKTLFVNSRMPAMVGYSREEFVELRSLSLVREKDRGRIAAKWASRRLGERDEYECQLAHKDGSWVPVRVEAVPLHGDDGEYDGNLALVTDLSDRKRTADALRDSALARDLQVGVLLQAPSAEIVFSNPKALELLGLTDDQLLGKTSFDPTWNVIHEDGAPFPGPTHPVPRAIATGRPQRNVVMGVFRPGSQDRVWLLVDAIPALDPDGRVLQVVCTFTDMTARKLVEDSLRESEERFALSMEATSDGLWDWDLRTDGGYFSPGYFRMLG